MMGQPITQDSALGQALVDGDVLQQAVAEYSARVEQRFNPERNVERVKRRAERATGQHPKPLIERKRHPAVSTALRTPDGQAYTLVGRKLVVFPDGASTARREWKAGEPVHRIGLSPQDAAGKKVERLRNESPVHKRMRRPIRDAWLEGGMAKLMAFFGRATAEQALVPSLQR